VQLGYPPQKEKSDGETKQSKYVFHTQYEFSNLQRSCLRGSLQSDPTNLKQSGQRKKVILKKENTTICE
jgi:hypothetical protein